jgi:CHAD domain-containing protein
MSLGALELGLPDGLDEGALLALLAERLTVDVGRVQTADRLLLDTFDARLRDAGLRAELAVGRGARRRLTLLEAGMPARWADVEAAPAIGVAALQAGPLRERLAPVLEERALVPLARLRSRTVPVAVLNDDAKTVVRLALEQAAVGDRQLARRLRVEPVRGYDRDFERVTARVRDGLGLAPLDTTLFDEAVMAAGLRPEGVQSKVVVDLVPGTRADVAAGQVLVPLADVAEANVPGVLEDLDTEFLHDLRVSIRRARSVLRELKGVHPAKARARLRNELKWAQGVTGPVRDLDVQLLEWDKLAGERAAELAPLRRLLEQRRARELVKLRRALRGRRFARAIEAWRALATAPPAAAGEDEPRAALPIETVAADRILRVYRRMVRDGRKIDDESPDEDLHELRKRGKELRYLLELFGSLFPSDVVKATVRALKDLQDVLGRFQDRTVQTAMLRATAEELAALPGGPDAVLAAGLIISALEADQRDAREHFAERFEAFSSDTERALVRDTVAKAGRV